MRKKCLLVSGLVALCTGAANAQSTLGEILDQGAKKITKEEWVAMLPVTTSGVWPSGTGEAALTFKPDGTISGNARHYPSGSTSSAYGTWTVDDTGKVCIDERFSSWPNTHQECSIRYRLGDQHFRIVSDPDRSAKVIKTSLSK